MLVDVANDLSLRVPAEKFQDLSMVVMTRLCPINLLGCGMLKICPRQFGGRDAVSMNLIVLQLG